jgi:sialate O-acetylesterase
MDGGKLSRPWRFAITLAHGVSWLLLGIPAPVLAATPALPAFAPAFGSGMVLPHGEPLTLQGRAAPRDRLVLEVAGRSYRFRSDARGDWTVQVAPLRVGGPYTLALRNEQGTATTLTDVLAGELWLCSGQSNMEFSVAASSDAPAAFLQGHPAIRLLSVAHQTALQPQRAFAESPVWQVASAENIRRFSGLCYFFARRKLEEDGLPIGLINASWGGSAIQPWISERQLAKLPNYRHQVDLLAQYRTNRRQAELAFAADWVKWWQGHSDMGPVWQRGVLDDNSEWRDAPLQDWRSYADPRLKSFTGNLWFSKGFELTAAQARRGASFVLGKIDEVDSTWVNGRFVNNSFGYGTRREYRLEPGMLQAGANQFSVFVTNTYDAGGMMGPEADVGIRFDDGEFLSLGSGWKYRFVPKETGYPPRAPSESVGGISGMFYGMVAPLRPLVPSGVIWYQGESNVDNAGAYEPLLDSLVEDWRHYFGRKLPFIIVQLPNYGAVAPAPVESGWAMLRNAQQRVAIRDAQVGMVVTQDLGLDNNLHPPRKYAVAERAVRVAQALRSGDAADGLVPRTVASDASTLRLDFLPPLAPAAGRDIQGFNLCAQAAGSCVPARAVQQGSTVEIARSALPSATRLRYCWSEGGTCELRSLSGVPASSFELPVDGGS